MLDAELARHRDHAPLLRGVELEPILETASQLLADEPLTGPELRAALAERFPAHDAAALAYACRCRLALVQVPPRGIWGRSSQVRVTTLASWLGRPLSAEPSLDEMVLRYLAAFGPASVADVTTWCRLTGMRQVVERLRPRLEALRDEDGQELFDLPGRPARTRTSPRRRGSCPSTTTCCSRMPTAAGSPRRATQGSGARPDSATARSSTTGSCAASGASSETARPAMRR